MSTIRNAKNKEYMFAMNPRTGDSIFNSQSLRLLSQHKTNSDKEYENSEFCTWYPHTKY